MFVCNQRKSKTKLQGQNGAGERLCSSKPNEILNAEAQYQYSYV